MCLCTINLFTDVYIYIDGCLQMIDVQLVRVARAICTLPLSASNAKENGAVLAFQYASFLMV